MKLDAGLIFTHIPNYFSWIPFLLFDKVPMIALENGTPQKHQKNLDVQTDSIVSAMRDF
jgi:hypothetical protein